MPNIVAIVNDDRVRRQTEQYLNELDIEGLRFALFKHYQEFSELYFREPSKTAETAAQEVSEAATETELRLFSEVDLLIFALDSIGEKPHPWMQKIKTSFKRFKYWPQTGGMRMIMLKYEDDGISKMDVLHPLLDDLIYMPLDRLVFLQKLEIFLHLPKQVKPRFLFTQEVKHEIEISKITRVDRLSDVALAIRNPIPLRKGLPGHFYVQLPGEKQRLEVRGKVLTSEAHPEYPGQYLVYFAYFGLAKNDLSVIRRTLSKTARYQSLLNDDSAAFRYRPDDLFSQVSASAGGKNFGVAIIDPDPLVASNLATQVGKDMDRLKVIAESSYSLFLHNYLDAGGAQGDRTPPKATEQNDIYSMPLVLTLDSSDFKCLSVDPLPTKDHLILGHNAEELFSQPERWLGLIVDKASRLVLEEAVQFALKGRSIDRVLILNDRENIRRALNFKFSKSTAEHLVVAEIRPASLSDIVTKINLEVANKEIEALILDSSFASSEPESWIEGLRTRAGQMGLTKGETALKFFLIADGEVKPSLAWLNCPDILGLFFKPVDHRQLLFLMSEYLPNKNTVYQFENMGWAQPNLPVHVSKAVHLEALSEFGVTLKSRQALAPGTMIFLRKSIYENAPNKCLAARVYACVEHSSEKDHFQVYATYFGINDQFLKFARTWIRENYASQKGKEN